MTDQPNTTQLSETSLVEILNRYHELARGNGALELVAAEIAGSGLYEIIAEVLDVARELGYGRISGPAWDLVVEAVRNYGARLNAEIETTKLDEGTKVRILSAPPTRLGAMVNLDSVGFVGSVAGGTVGTFRGMHPSELLTGWALVDVAAADVELGAGITLDDLGNVETLVVPVHASAVEKIQ